MSEIVTLGSDSGRVDVVLNDPCVCPVHVRVGRHAPAQLWIEDLGSVHGTFLDGHRLLPNQAVPLRDGQTLGLGSNVELLVDQALLHAWFDGALAPQAEQQAGAAATGTPDSGGVLSLDGDRWLIGRDAECDIVVDAANVSSRHAMLSRMSDGRFLLEDIGSTNGVRLHRYDNRIEQAVVRSDDTVFLGKNVYRVGDLVTLAGEASVRAATTFASGPAVATEPEEAAGLGDAWFAEPVVTDDLDEPGDNAPVDVIGFGHYRVYTGPSLGAEGALGFGSLEVGLAVLTVVAGLMYDARSPWLSTWVAAAIMLAGALGLRSRAKARLRHWGGLTGSALVLRDAIALVLTSAWFVVGLAAGEGGSVAAALGIGIVLGVLSALGCLGYTVLAKWRGGWSYVLGTACAFIVILFVLFTGVVIDTIRGMVPAFPGELRVSTVCIGLSWVLACVWFIWLAGAYFSDWPKRHGWVRGTLRIMILQGVVMVIMNVDLALWLDSQSRGMIGAMEGMVSQLASVTIPYVGAAIVGQMGLSGVRPT